MPIRRLLSVSVAVLLSAGLFALQRGSWREVVPGGPAADAALVPVPVPAATTTTAATTPPTEAPTTAATRPPAPATTAAAGPPPVAVAEALARSGWTPTAGEVHLAEKAAAADAAVRLTTYGPDATVDDVAGSVGAAPAAVDPLHHAGSTSRGTVVYPQMGGFRPDHASVMVVVRQDIVGADGAGREETRTLDVRVARTPDGWAFRELASAGGEPVARPADLAPTAAAVVDHPRIELPDSARWDIYRGAVRPRLLDTMLALAERTPYAVVVLSAGHPHNVYATERTSNHTNGRAVDVYRVGDRLVADDRGEPSATRDAAAWLLARGGLSELGSPWRLGGGSFTDTVHQDHLHVAVAG